LLLGVDSYDASQPYHRMFNRVQAINGSNVTFTTPVPEAINGTSHKCVTFDALVENITVDGLTLDYDGAFAGDTALWFDKCRHVTCRNVRVESYPGGIVVEASRYVALNNVTENVITTNAALSFFGALDCSVNGLDVLDAKGIILNFETQNRRLKLDALDLARGASGFTGQYTISVLGHSTDVEISDVDLSGDATYPNNYFGINVGEASTAATETATTDAGIRNFNLKQHTGSIDFRGTAKNGPVSSTTIEAIPSAANNLQIALPAGWYKKLELTFDNVTDIGTVYLMPGSADIAASLAAGVVFNPGDNYTTLADAADYPFCVTEPKYLWFFSPSYAGGNVTIHVERFA
jgi:hypothetical protein